MGAFDLNSRPAQVDISMGPLDLANFVLTQFATVDEVREGLKHIC
jgi:hypothetical protein